MPETDGTREGPGPKVFLSHASEDKDRFVLRFAGELRAKGIDVWVDRWEMLPGDSLVQSIFEEGLKNASAVIVVLSNFSLMKRWVAEELDAAAVKRIETGSRLIPIALDGLRPEQIPLSIRHLLFESVSDLDDLDVVVERVAAGDLQQAGSAAVGKPSGVRAASAAKISGLDQVDSLVLKAIGDEALRDDGTRFTTTEFLSTVTAELEISEEQAVESLTVLEHRGSIKISRTLGGGIAAMANFGLADSGLYVYAYNYLDGFDTMEQTVLARLKSWAGDGAVRTLTELCEASTDVPPMLVELFLTRCAGRRLLVTSEGMGGREATSFMNISPAIRRIDRT